MSAENDKDVRLESYSLENLIRGFKSNQVYYLIFIIPN